MTTLENVTTELEALKLPTTGIYSKIPKLTFRLVLDILHFGESAIKKSTLGKGIKELAIEIAIKDGRKSIICPLTFKNILV